MRDREIKAELRRMALERRDRLDETARAEMSLAAAGHGDAALSFAPGAVISGFLPIRSEINPRPLLDRLRARGGRLCLPAILDRMTITFREFERESALVDTGFGTIGPGMQACQLDPQIMLVPLAAFDRYGNRIGYGAGHYDRAIARLHAKGLRPELIGLAFSEQEVDRVPRLPHDMPIDAIVTELGFRRFNGT
jgi:5-formyltetrahydrofolate cyclo-ligase